jgi:hypothetical protein
MGYFIAMVLGYLLGSRTGKDLDQLSSSVKALRESDEFADVVSAARSHVGHTLRGLASMVDGSDGPGVAPDRADGSDGSDGDGRQPSNDLVERVRHIFGQNAQ